MFGWRETPAQNEGQNMSEAGPAIDPIHQFHINPIVPLHIFGIDASFTNASLFMVIILAVISFIMIIGTSGSHIVPGRLQTLAEMAYEFVASMVRQSSGDAGMRFFPFVFSVFMFVVCANLIGLIPYTFTVTSQIIVTFAFAAFIILTVIVYGVYKNGARFLNLFVPSGVSPILLPFIVLIEVISFAARPISLSVRLFGNMLAGHITLKIFGGFVTLLLGAGAYALLAPLPLIGIILLTAFELLVAVLQAYVFAILTCVYLNDAIHPGH
jgi:F-type H+-transporting ATPase subunit a